ncbi:hypothetical protein [Phyllobacterium myrsinacearum]|uniref:Uncharacterized protein n=1 Tax=Phyllobacterium myrsinacearum TaxID=28101 RepID=A0A2S9JPJ1_9HYPH|nr:hypothetical protein [Phyllobacterium myrsinacearum]PRD54992.1 hypothetical protein C5750_07285 [Phyllobacterium myrsinacearum]PWV90460.1 hypothetical protein DEV92_107184 [Phyllobacterium myrsinacearum]RZV05346.1 hypothetical protein EV654_2792 [Phyllobacterium myrsinacearum]
MALDVRRQEDRLRSQTGGVSGRIEVSKVDRVQLQAFDASLARSALAAKQRRDPFVGQTGRLRKPKLANLGIFDLGRSEEILRYLIKEVLPTLDMDKDVATITAMLLTEEIDSRRELQDRLNQAQSQ